MQFAIGDPARLARIVALPEDRDLIRARRQMAVDAIGADVERAVLEPADEDIIEREGRVLTRVNGVIQSIALPCSPQKPSGSLTERAYIS
jgi:hypothetical protein